MKTITLFLLVSILAVASNQKMKSDRVWTFTFYEFGLLQEKQRDEFAKLLFEESQKNLILSSLIEDKTEIMVKNTLLSATKWNLVEFKINRACQDKKNYSLCQKLALLRQAVLEKQRAHK